DKAGQKGTGKWTLQSAIDLGIPISTIYAAVEARVLSSMKDERVAASQILPAPEPAGTYEGDRQEFIQAVHDALYASKVVSYAQGMALLRRASDEYQWDLKLDEIAAIWRGGCIIRAKFLNRITEAFRRNADLNNLLLDPFFTDVMVRGAAHWREVVATAQQRGIAVPAFAASLNYFDSYRSARLPQNLLQAQRDYFGAHTYERIDQEGSFHTDWIGESEITPEG
ncbi:MAG: NADP-dependent phosphogluconate dehydrogenase, partial [Armatimonadota bacterium]|nr:NADP-dependent phosphogluconate dehydrogenase [Armatimonadota bacterium]